MEAEAEAEAVEAALKLTASTSLILTQFLLTYKNKPDQCFIEEIF